MKNFAFLTRKEILWPALMVTLIGGVDFCTRIMIWSDATNRDLVRPPLSSSARVSPYQLKDFETLAASLQQPIADTAATSAAQKTDVQTRQFGDLNLKLLAIYQDRGFVAVVRVVRSEQSQAELIRIKQGDHLEQLTVTNLESHQISIEFAGETTTIQLFKPGSGQG